jgi:hypothetical protein
MKTKLITWLLVILVIGLIYIAFFKGSDVEDLYKDRMARTELMEKRIKIYLDSLSKNIQTSIDSLAALKVEKTIIRNNYIGVSNEVDSITTLDSANAFIRERMRFLIEPKFE